MIFGYWFGYKYNVPMETWGFMKKDRNLYGRHIYKFFPKDRLCLLYDTRFRSIEAAFNQGIFIS